MIWMIFVFEDKATRIEGNGKLPCQVNFSSSYWSYQISSNSGRLLKCCMRTGQPCGFTITTLVHFTIALLQSICTKNLGDIFILLLFTAIGLIKLNGCIIFSYSKNNSTAVINQLMNEWSSNSLKELNWSVVSGKPQILIKTAEIHMLIRKIRQKLRRISPCRMIISPLYVASKKIRKFSFCPSLLSRQSPVVLLVVVIHR